MVQVVIVVVVAIKGVVHYKIDDFIFFLWF